MLERDLSFKSHIKASANQGGAKSNETESNTESNQQTITSFFRQGSALVYTQRNKVGFVHAEQGRLGSVQCAVAHDIELMSVQMDYQSSVWLYALSPAEREIYVFRTSNLLNVPVATSCEL